MFNHAYTVAFEVVSEHKNPDEISDKEVLAALIERVAYLTRNPNEICQACDEYDVYDMQTNSEARAKANCGHEVSVKEMIVHNGITCCEECYHRIKGVD